ncbi:VCBS repeat-containing protein [Streptomyces sp. V1I1]|uniref:FG-GAP repeat domain-containing protein n=1 Tax=Streptomyces sp. V1I1 TaxID=3042272 RepID=UPI0027D8069C|nr:VCBS repeat-containing protein [Streptomyces sp. V1I1]
MAVALAAVLSVLGQGAAVTPQAVAATACAGAQSDFNGDGIRDVAIADPEATVSGKERAGLIRIVYGGGKGTFELSQDSPEVSDGAETGDQFGFSFAVYDANLDGCSDIAVGIPYEDINLVGNTIKDAGLVHLIYGSPAGIASGGQGSYGFRQGSDGKLGGGYEAEDWVGYAVAAGKSATGFPFLVIGVPGEDGAGGADMGMIHYVYGTAYDVASVSQDTTGVWEEAEAYDRFGASISATDRHFVVGAPGESIGAVESAGGVIAFRPSINSLGVPDPLFGMGQGRTPGPDTAAQVDDRYGTSLATAPYRPASAATTTDSLLAVGVPGEDLSTTVDAGAVHLYHIKADGTVTLLKWIDQNQPGVEGDTEAGDFFGQRLAAVNTATNVVSTATTMRLAVGVPGRGVHRGVPGGGRRTAVLDARRARRRRQLDRTRRRHSVPPGSPHARRHGPRREPGLALRRHSLRARRGKGRPRLRVEHAERRCAHPDLEAGRRRNPGGERCVRRARALTAQVKVRGETSQ